MHKQSSPKAPDIMASDLEDLKNHIFCLAANVDLAGDKSSFDVYREPRGSGPTFTVTTLHISCKSDTYQGSGGLYGGIIIYGHNGQGDWRTANGTHCKSGYVVITRTDTKEFKDLQKKWRQEPGQVHGVVYRKAFGESLNDVTAVGEGFGVKNGQLTTNSGALNPVSDHYHDSSKSMHKDSEWLVKELIKIWRDARPNFPARQNYTVKELAD